MAEGTNEARASINTFLPDWYLVHLTRRLTRCE